jgi:surface polysaccharide O-acyltransferase-like enzyme
MRNLRTVFASLNTFDSDRINSFRGLACALLVAHHITLLLLEYRQIESTTVLVVDNALAYFRMPAFALVSGIILGITKSEIGARSFLFRKFERLIIPFLFVTIIMIAGRSVARGDVSLFDIPYFWIYPPGHMWFLSAVFIFFAFSAAFSQIWDLRSTKGSTIFLLVAFAISAIPLAQDLPFGINLGAKLFPFFALGLLVANRRREVPAFHLYAIVAAAAFAITVIQVVSGDPTPLRNAFQCAVVLVSFAITPRNGALAYLGKYSFTVYLFHATLISIGIRLMPGQPLAAGAGIFLSAVLVPILIEMSLKRFAPFALPLIGQKRRVTASATPVPLGGRF